MITLTVPPVCVILSAEAKPKIVSVDNMAGTLLKAERDCRQIHLEHKGTNRRFRCAYKNIGPNQWNRVAHKEELSDRKDIVYSPELYGCLDLMTSNELLKVVYCWADSGRAWMFLALEGSFGHVIRVGTREEVHTERITAHERLRDRVVAAGKPDKRPFWLRPGLERMVDIALLTVILGYVAFWIYRIIIH